MLFHFLTFLHGAMQASRRRRFSAMGTHSPVVMRRYSDPGSPENDPSNIIPPGLGPESSYGSLHTSFQITPASVGTLTPDQGQLQQGRRPEGSAVSAAAAALAAASAAGTRPIMSPRAGVQEPPKPSRLQVSGSRPSCGFEGLRLV